MGVISKTITEPTTGEYNKGDRANYGSNATTHEFNNNAKFKLRDKILKILQDNAFNETDRGDVIDHTAKVLEILELIKILDVNPNQLRLHIFPLSLTGDAQKWWMDEVDGKVTT
nr:hypothetical protein [Tanacetum cinerariifolium]